MLFEIGKLYLAEGDSILIGDPCYIPDSIDLILKYKKPWIKGNLLRVYVYMTNSSIFGRDPRNSAFILSSKDNELRDINKYKLNFIGHVGVDSGQVSFLGSSLVETWVKFSDDDSAGYFNPNSDLDACSQVTLEYQLSAGAHEKHIKFKISGSQARKPMATVFSSATFDGDGTYSVYELNTKGGDKSTTVGLMVDFAGKYRA